MFLNYINNMTPLQKIINKELQNRNICSHGFFITMSEHHRIYQYMTYKKTHLYHKMMK